MDVTPRPTRRLDLGAAGRRLFRTPRGRWLYLLLAFVFFVLFVRGVCTVYVGPNEFAVKQVTVGRASGIRPEILYPGWHFVSPGTERLHVFPTDLQSLDLTNDRNERPKDDKRVTPALNIQTSEGYTVTVDISVLYRIEDPYRVLTTIGPGKLYEDALVIPRVEQLLRKRLGELDAEDFYDVGKRAARVARAHEELNAEMLPNGVRVTHVFVRRYVYDQRYQAAIEQRKIQDQTVFKNRAEAELATATAERDRVLAQGQATVKVELARGDAERAKLAAEADLYTRKQRAAGELATSLAEAEGTRLENEALRGVGAENLVGLKMAEVLRGTRIIVVPTDGESGVNPLDLRSALKRFDVKE